MLTKLDFAWTICRITLDTLYTMYTYQFVWSYPVKPLHTDLEWIEWMEWQYYIQFPNINTGVP